MQQRLRKGSTVNLDQMTPEAQKERFFGNEYKAQLEGEFTNFAHNFGVNTNRALILCGPNSRRHQYMARRFDEVVFAENNEDRFQLANEYLSGIMKRVSKDGAITVYRNMTGSEPITPRITRLYMRDVFEVFGKKPNYGLIDLDMCCTLNPKLITGIHYMLNENQVFDKWALRVTVARRGVIGSGETLLDQVGELISNSPYQASKQHHTFYREFWADEKKCGTPMMMAQWLLDNKVSPS